jgi:predicted O-methyltransferase YrrM
MILNPEIERYMHGLLPPRDAVLAEMEQVAERRKIPIIGPAVARVLAQLVMISGAKRIFELGSAIGYSTIWLARAAGPEAEVYYTDGDPANEKRARDYATRAGVADRIKFMVGDAIDLIDETSGEFDLIFIDVDKHQYPAALKKALPRLRSGGLLITDNTLWSGRVTRPAKKKDKETRGIQQFNRAVYSSDELFPVIIPLRDGVSVCLKSPRPRP